MVMTVEEALAILDTVLDEGLNDVQRLVFRHSWEEWSYQEIARTAGYDPDYIKDVGSRLWKLLRQELGEKFTKTSVKAPMERYLHKQHRGITPSKSLMEVDKTSEALNVGVIEKYQPSASDKDMDEAPTLEHFFGRARELETLTQWIVQDHSRLVALLGMGGIGKTALAAKLTEQIQNQFECIIWRSLGYAPPLLAMLGDLNAFLTNEPQTDTNTTVEGQISRLLKSLRDRRCLLILDDWEMLLQSGDIAGYYRCEYEGYGELLKRVREASHQSCLLIVSREKPIEVASPPSDRTLQLKGLEIADAKELLATKGFSGAENGLDELIQLYRGNPAALKNVATTIKEFFNRNIAKFVGQSSLVIGDIFSNLLDEHFERLSDLEKTMMYWLAIERQPVPIERLKNNLWEPVSRSELLEMLESLRRRSLIEKEVSSLTDEALFTLQPVVMKYITNRFVEQVFQDINNAITTGSIDKLGLLKSHALVKEEPELADINTIQKRLILKRIKERLYRISGDEKHMKEQLKNLLGKLREYSDRSIGYAGDNLLKLLGSANG